MPNFPSHPSHGQPHTEGDRTWVWDDTLGVWTHPPGAGGTLTFGNRQSLPPGAPTPPGTYMIAQNIGSSTIEFPDGQGGSFQNVGTMLAGLAFYSDGTVMNTMGGGTTIHLVPVFSAPIGAAPPSGGGIEEPDQVGQFLRAWDGSDGSWVEPPPEQPAGPPMAQAQSPRWNFQGTKQTSGNTANTVSLAEIPVGFRPTGNVTQAIQVPAGNITAQMYTSGTNVFPNVPGTNATTGNTRWSIRFSASLASNAAISANVAWQTADAMP